MMKTTKEAWLAIADYSRAVEVFGHETRITVQLTKMYIDDVISIDLMNDMTWKYIGYIYSHPNYDAADRNDAIACARFLAGEDTELQYD